MNSARKSVTVWNAPRASTVSVTLLDIGGMPGYEAFITPVQTPTPSSIRLWASVGRGICMGPPRRRRLERGGP